MEKDYCSGECQFHTSKDKTCGGCPEIGKTMPKEKGTFCTIVEECRKKFPNVFEKVKKKTKGYYFEHIDSYVRFYDVLERDHKSILGKIVKTMPEGDTCIIETYRKLLKEEIPY